LGWRDGCSRERWRRDVRRLSSCERLALTDSVPFVAEEASSPPAATSKVSRAGVRRAPTIDTGWRVLATFLGLLGLGAGGVAVFVTDVEAGPVALLVVGLILLMVAAGGRLPSRIKYKDTEAEWAIEEFVERVAEAAPRQQVPAVVEALNDLRGTAPAAAAAGLSRIASLQSYEQEVSDLITQAVNDLNALNIYEPVAFVGPPLNDMGFDALITTPGPPRNSLLVEVKLRAGQPLPTSVVNQIVGGVVRFKEFVGTEGSVRGLIVSNVGLTQQAQNYLPEDVRSVTVASKADYPKLRDAIREGLNL
jgi:hypothetical protein